MFVRGLPHSHFLKMIGKGVFLLGERTDSPVDRWPSCAVLEAADMSCDNIPMESEFTPWCFSSRILYNGVTKGMLLS